MPSVREETREALRPIHTLDLNPDYRRDPVEPVNYCCLCNRTVDPAAAIEVRMIEGAYILPNSDPRADFERFYVGAGCAKKVPIAYRYTAGTSR